MPRRRRIDLDQGLAAVRSWALDPGVARPVLATAVRFCLEELADRAPGPSVEVRVPPFGVTQCLTGPRHTRGTPPNVVETDARTWLLLATGLLDLPGATADGALRLSGSRTGEVAALLPLVKID